MQLQARFSGLTAAILLAGHIQNASAIMAGGECDLSDDTPSLQLDVAGWIDLPPHCCWATVAAPTGF